MRMNDIKHQIRLLQILPNERFKHTIVQDVLIPLGVCGVMKGSEHKRQSLLKGRKITSNLEQGSNRNGQPKGFAKTH